MECKKIKDDNCKEKGHSWSIEEKRIKKKNKSEHSVAALAYSAKPQHNEQCRPPVEPSKPCYDSCVLKQVKNADNQDNPCKPSVMRAIAHPGHVSFSCRHLNKPPFISLQGTAGFYKL
jgi:hypothetical protein